MGKGGRLVNAILVGQSSALQNYKQKFELKLQLDTSKQ
jgi:hypothetical protein